VYRSAGLILAGAEHIFAKSASGLNQNLCNDIGLNHSRPTSNLSDQRKRPVETWRHHLDTLAETIRFAGATELSGGSIEDFVPLLT
jgi:hypothetical protein